MVSRRFVTDSEHDSNDLPWRRRRYEALELEIDRELGLPRAHGCDGLPKVRSGRQRRPKHRIDGSDVPMIQHIEYFGHEIEPAMWLNVKVLHEPQVEVAVSR